MNETMVEFHIPVVKFLFPGFCRRGVLNPPGTKVCFAPKVLIGLKIFTLAFAFFFLLSDFKPVFAQNEAVFLYQEAMSEYSNRRLKPAADKFNELIEKFPEHPLAERAKIELARIHIDQREFDRAIEKLTPLAEKKTIDSNVRQAREMLLKQLADLQRFKAGVEFLEKWWKETPGDVEIGRNLAAFYLQSGKPDEARILLEGLLERTADRDVFGDLLNLSSKSGNIENLLSSIEQRKARYRTLDYLEFASDCLLALKEEKKAADLLHRAPETKKSLSLLKKLGRIDLSLNEPQKALQTFKILQAIVPGDWENIKAVGHCHFLLKQKKEAIVTWRLPLTQGGFGPQESYQQLAEVLIEHKLYQETLDVFSEARKILGNSSMFAEERARVLEAMGNLNEALEEYLTALSYGPYKQDIFDKLYKSQNSGFVLKARLKQLMDQSISVSIKKALLEVYFRETLMESIPEILTIDNSGGVFDEILFERIQQALAAVSSDFLQRLMVSFIRRNRSSSLAFKLCISLLEVPDQDDVQAKESLAEAEMTVEADPCPDLGLKIRLQVAMGRFAMERFNNPEKARKFLTAAIDKVAEDIAPVELFDGLILLMRLRVNLDDFAGARDLIERAGKLPVFEDGQPRLLYEQAWLSAQEGNFQEALGDLKKLTNDYPESLWLNDGLNLALFLTMGSTGTSLEPMKKYFEAERIWAVGSITAAIDRMKEAGTMASGTPLELDSQAKVLLMSESLGSTTPLIGEIDDWKSKHPAHWMIPDLLLLKWRLLKRDRPEKNNDQILEVLREFTDRFPGDLRSRRASVTIQEMMREKGKNKK